VYLQVHLRGENFEGNYCIRFGATIVPAKLLDNTTVSLYLRIH